MNTTSQSRSVLFQSRPREASDFNIDFAGNGCLLGRILSPGDLGPAPDRSLGLSLLSPALDCMCLFCLHSPPNDAIFSAAARNLFRVGCGSYAPVLENIFCPRIKIAEKPNNPLYIHFMHTLPKNVIFDVTCLVRALFLVADGTKLQ